MRTITFPFETDFDAIIDVRSPSEFAIDHLPGAISLPIMSDSERAEVGTLDRQVGNFEAKRRGAAIASRNIAGHLEQYFADKPRSFRPLIYCWRGGQRSGSLALVLQQIGFPVARLEGGYKAFRRHVVACLETLPKDLDLWVLDGPTGSRKTDLLFELSAQGAQVIDLEALANHRGSLLGANPDGSPQPSQKAFETALWEAVRVLDLSKPVFVEGESAKIGQIFVPAAFFAAMKRARRLHVLDSLERRAAYLCQQYRHLAEAPAQLASLLTRLRYRHGNAQVDAWLDKLNQGEVTALVEDLLVQHYDPAYRHGGASLEGPGQGGSRGLDFNLADAASRGQDIAAVAKSIHTAAQGFVGESSLDDSRVAN